VLETENYHKNLAMILTKAKKKKKKKKKKEE